MKYLVTGGAGFIGSHLVERLLEHADVIVLDDFSEGKREYLPLDNPRLIVYEASILEPINNLFEGVDIVYHLAALPRPQKSIAEPEGAHDVNVTGTLRVLMACLNNKVRRLVFASSATIYGEQGRYPTSEACKPNPMSPYALHKLVGEQYCQLFESIYGLETNCLRLFNVYGSRMNPDGSYASLMPKFIKLMRQGEPPPIYGTGAQSRDFVYIDDVIDAFLMAGWSDAHGEVINIGSEKTYAVRVIFDLLRSRLSVNVNPVYEPAVIEPEMTLADCEKAQRVLGWRSITSISEGIDRIMECY